MNSYLRRTQTLILSPWYRTTGIGSVVGTIATLFLFLFWQLFAANSGTMRAVVGDVFFGVSNMCVVIIAWLAATHPGLDKRVRLMWFLFTIGLVCSGLGNLVWMYYDLRGEEVYPSFADLFYLAYYPFILCGLLVFPITPRRPGETQTFWLDVSTVMVGGCLLVWYIIIRPTVAIVETDTIELLLALLYPASSLVLLFSLSVAALRQTSNTYKQVLRLLIAGLVVHFLAELIFSTMSLYDLYSNGNWYDMLYLVSYCCIAASGLEQLRTTKGALVDSSSPPLPPMSVLPYIAVGIGFCLLLVAAQPYWGTALAVIIYGVVLMTGLVLARQILAVRENGRLLTEKAAHEVETRLRVLVEHASDVILLVDASGVVSYCSASLSRVFGYETMPNQWNVSMIVHPDDKIYFLHNLAKLAATSDIPALECRFVHADGSFRAVEIVGQSTLTNQDKQGIVLTLRDISDRQARLVAETANRAKSTFIANMSHELRTPLTAILGYCDVLLADLSQTQHSRIKEDISRIQRAGEHLRVLINDVLDLSKLEAGKMTLVLEHVHIEQLVQDVLSTCQPLINANHNTVVFNSSMTQPVCYTDATKVRQILMNIVSNAAKFTESGTITLDASVDTSNDSTPMLQLIVRDTGIGIAAERVGALFQPFTQATPQTTKLYGGTGIGLALSQQICQVLGGDISIKSVENQGTTVFISLPVTTTQQEATVPAAPEQAMPLLDPTSAPPEILTSTTSSIILVVDDDPSVANILARVLSDTSWTVIPALSGTEGLELARALQPDAIILDVYLPDIDGWTVLTQLKADPDISMIPVLMLTIDDQHERGFALGASDFVTKPFAPQQIASILQHYRTCAPLLAKPNHVLVIEDQNNLRDLLQRSLENDGWVVQAVGTGQAALATIINSVPAAVVTDLMLPDMNGVTLINALQQRAKAKIPVVVVTGVELSATMRAHLSETVDALLIKGGRSCTSVLDEVKHILHNRLNG